MSAPDCGACHGTGEGQYDGANCSACRGTGIAALDLADEFDEPDDDLCSADEEGWPV